MGRTGRRRSKPKRRRVDDSSTDKQPGPSSSSGDSIDSLSHEKSTCSTPENAEIPEFDPSVENRRMDLWLAKVNECAAIMKWDESQTIRSALNKLVGDAKKWYQSQACVLRSWERWQSLLTKAFPRETEYPELLKAMLNRHYNLSEDVEEYYYDKMSLLYACDISGRNAVDCVIHGIEDGAISDSATLSFFTNPEDLFAFLKEVCNDRRYIKDGRCA